MRESNEQMNNQQNSRAKFKQRVAGGAVLLIVLAIFLPFIFNHSHMGANTSVDNTAAPADQAQPSANNVNAAAQATAQAGQDPAAAQTQVQPQAQNQAADPAAPAPAASAAPVAQTAAPAAAQAGAAGAQQDAAAGADQSMRSDQPGLTSPQSESAAAPQAQAQAQAQAPAPVATVQPAQPAVTAPVAQQSSAVAPSAPVAKKTPAARTSDTVAAAVKTKPAKTDVKVTAKGHWLVQVGSFTQPEYAQQLVSKLRARGLHAYAKHEPNHLVRVYVGPVANQEQALKIQQQVQEQFQLSSLVKQNRA